MAEAAANARVNSGTDTMSPPASTTCSIAKSAVCRQDPAGGIQELGGASLSCHFGNNYAASFQDPHASAFVRQHERCQALLDLHFDALCIKASETSSQRST